MSNEIDESIYLDEVEAPSSPPQPSTNDHSIESLNSHCPQAPRTVFKPIHLNFTRKLAKTTGKLSRAELEELLHIKIAEAIVYREKNTKLRLISERHEEMVKNLESRLTDCQKHIRDLEYINDNIMQRIQQMPNEPLKVVRIERNIGVQIYEQDLMPGEIYTIDLSDEAEGQRNPFRRSPVRSPPPPPPARKNNRTKRKLALEEKKKKEDQKRVKRKKKIQLDSTLLPEETQQRTLRSVNLSNEKNKSRSEPSNQEKAPKTGLNKSSEISTLNLTTLEPQFSSTLISEKESKKTSRTTFEKRMQLDSTLIEDDDSEEPARKNSRLEMTLEMPSIVFRSPKKLTNPIKNAQILENLEAAVKEGSYPKLPERPTHELDPKLKKSPSQPIIEVTKNEKGFEIKWKLEGFNADSYAEIKRFELFFNEINSDTWESEDFDGKVMSIAISDENEKSYFTLRAIDCHERFSEFAQPKLLE